MEKFEYLQLVYNSFDSVSLDIDNELNRFGANGWEAYAVRSINKNDLQIFLKRKISE